MIDRDAIQGMQEHQPTPITPQPIKNEQEDIIQRKQVEAVLRESERRFREMIDALPTAIYTTDAEGRLTYFNPAAVEFSGRVPALGTDHWCVTWKLYHPDGRPMPHDQCPMAIALKEGHPVRGVQAIAERPDGKRIWFEPHATPLRDSAGKIVGGINMLVDITERKRAEQASAMLASIVESSGDAIVSKTLEGVITSWNAMAERMFGYTAEEAVGQSILMIIPPELQHQEPEILKQVRRGEHVHLDTVRVARDGRRIDISLNVSPVRDASGHIIGASKIARDITARKRAEEASRRNEALYRALATNLPGGAAFVVDREFRYLLAEGEALQLEGMTPADLEGKTIWEALEPELAELTALYYRQALAGEPFYWEYETQGRYFVSRGVPLRSVRSDQGSHQDEVYAVLAVSYEITELVRAREIAQQVQQELAAVLERSQDIFFVVDQEWCFAYLNHAGLQLAGKSAEEMLGQNLWESYPYLLGTIYETVYRKAMAEQQVIRFEAYSPGGERCFETTVYPSAEGLAVMAQDITERKEMEARLRQAYDMLEQQVAERTQELSEANRRLQQEIALRERTAVALAEVRRRLDQSREAERLHLAQELHDGSLQELIALQFSLAKLVQNLPDDANREMILNMGSQLQVIGRQLRVLTQELRPPMLAHYGLSAAIRAHVEKMQQTQSMPPVELALHEGELTLPEATALTLFRICQQAVHNTLQHAQANRLTIRLFREGGQVVLEVKDDGIGFEMPDQWAELARAGHLGIAGMAERAASIGGRLEVFSAPGLGVSIRVWAPVSEG
jgi:PAS domain S-box-containing protein